jgi:threonine synthase
MILRCRPTAKAGIKCVVPECKIVFEKLSWIVVYGAEVLEIEESFDEAANIFLLWSIQSILSEYKDKKTQLMKHAKVWIDQSPDYQFMPVDNTGNIVTYWKDTKRIQVKICFS